MKTLDPETLPLQGTAVVEASAGTGKTYTITSLFLRLLVEGELTIDQILVVTYTRAATAELRDRIRKRLAAALLIARGEPSDDALLVRLCANRPDLSERLERALAGVDEAPVLTIHGFCQRVLGELAFESGSAFDAQLLAHAAPLLEEIADDYFMRELYAAPAERASALLNEPSSLRELAARVGGRELRVLPAQVDEAASDHEAYRKALAHCRALWADHRATVTEIVRGLKGVGSNADKWSDTAHELLRAGVPVDFRDKASFLNFTRSGALKKAKGALPDHPFLDAAEELYTHACARVEAERSLTLGFRRGFVDYVQHELDRRARESRVRTFDALLSDLDRALEGPSGPLLVERLRQKYKAALVDEFQDTDPLQYRIFRRVFADGQTPLLLIGDPKQAIYGFRGADVSAYLAAREEAGEHVYTLDTNWRSDPALIDALNALYAKVTLPFALPEIDYQPVRAAQRDRLHVAERRPFDIAFLAEPAAGADALERQLAEHVASDIAALLASGAQLQDGSRTRPLAARDIAVLTRKNKQAAMVQQALAARRIPSVLSGDASVLDSDDVAQLERALHALAHPADARALRSFLSSIYGGFDAAYILALEAKDALWEEHRTHFARLHELWLARGFVQAVRSLSELYDVERRLLERPDGTRRITNLWHLVELLAEASASQRLGPLGLLRWLALVQQDQAMRTELVGDAHELRLESNEDAVQLTTIHKSKGLEYPIVYLPFSWTAAELFPAEKKLPRFHDPSACDALTLDLGSEQLKDHVKIAEVETVQEALRLLYVGLTRAKHRVTLVIPQHKGFAKSALAYTLFGGGDRDLIIKNVEALTKDQRLQLPTMRNLALRPSPAYVGKAPQVNTGARKVQRALDQSYRVASFSALIARERTVASEQGIDRDATPAQPPSDEQEPVSTLTLGSFPRGTVAGQLVHEVLEHADFSAGPDALALVVERFVRARGYPLELVDSLTRGLDEMLATPLSSNLTLNRLERASRVDEMEFVFPVERMLSPRTLERAFRNHDAPRAYPAYAKYVKELGFDELHGYLRGFIDLVFRHEGRYFIVDYKSNWLGPRPEDYGDKQLAEAMAHHHYYLQYHLYAVALHRHLAQRLPGYQYEQHFGGVYYLFLRGMAPAHALRTGVYFDRPPRGLIEELDRALRPEAS
ncbi:MAG TPA: exodeoxyribonuclease V subunit beta [Polyangiales bacterium]|nr:exodeoxyribonuclease V subunit beta [Polyangiales bacterium]